MNAKRTTLHLLRDVLMAGSILASSHLAAAETITNVAQFYESARSGYYSRMAVALEGVVCWVDPVNQSLFILEDDAGSAVAVMPEPPVSSLAPGTRIRLEGDCSAQRHGFGFVMTLPLAVDNDGLHNKLQKSGTVFLKAGMNPFRLDWFNSSGTGLLNVSLEGPGFKGVIPKSMLFHRKSASAAPFRFQPGLQFSVYDGLWDFIPHFKSLAALTNGIATNLDLSVSARHETVGIEFDGYLKLPEDGRYTFSLESDDGSLLFAGPSPAVTRLGQQPVPAPQVFFPWGAPPGERKFARYTAEGEVIFVDKKNRQLRLTLQAGDHRLTFDVMDAPAARPELLLGSRLKAMGIGYGVASETGESLPELLWIPSWDQVEIVSVASDRWNKVRKMTITELSTNAPAGLVRIGGIVQAKGPDGKIVVRDGTGDASVQCGENQNVGSRVEVVGTLQSGRNGPVLKYCLVKTQPSHVQPDEQHPNLTSLAAVRELSPAEASNGFPVHVRGVVTATFGHTFSVVIQEEDQGIYVRVPPTRRSRLEVGDLLEVEGVTIAATWAPMIDAQKVTRLGFGRLPEPLHPSRDQILNGSLDSQYVEIQGIVTDVHPGGAALITRVGRIEIELDAQNQNQEWKGYENALVRVRGCVLAVYDRTTKLIVSGKLHFIQPSVSVDEFPAGDLFDLPTKSIASLRSFDPRANVFQRVKVKGQVIHAHDGLYCLMDGKNGLRFSPKNEIQIPLGTEAEVVGIVDMEGPSPTLREAMVRLEGTQPFPEAATLAETNLVSALYDATWVRLEGTLLNFSRSGNEQILELRSGTHVHMAKLSIELGNAAEIPVGSQISLAGVYIGKGGDWAVGKQLDSFEIILNSPADIRVLARPSWWTPKRLIALLSLFALVLLLAFAWIRILRRQVEERTQQLATQILARERIEQQRVVEQERSRLARDLHDDLGGGLTEISMLGSLANENTIAPERKANYLLRMTENARHLVTALDEIVWAVNPRYDSTSSLASYYSLYAQRLLNLAAIECKLEISDTLPDLPLDSTMRHNLFLAYKEALNNVIRHAHATEVQVSIYVENEELNIEVMDNGHGLKRSPDMVGMDGLKNMQDRMAALGGRFKFKSSPQAGTTVTFIIALNEPRNDQSSHHRRQPDSPRKPAGNRRQNA